jgi:3-dehydroquinate synthase II
LCVKKFCVIEIDGGLMVENKIKNENKNETKSEMRTEKELIIDIRPYNKELVTSALEAGIKTIIIPNNTTSEAHKLGRIETISEDGDKKLGKEIFEQEINSKADENKALELVVGNNKNNSVIVSASDWKIIPLENLVSKSENVYVTCTPNEIPTMLNVLEKGVKGVIIKPKNRAEIMEAVKIFGKQSPKLNLVEAEVTNIKVLGSGERACVDTCNVMSLGEGMLVGNSPKMLFLVQSESMEVEYCASRPFRVNAGAVHSYVLMPEEKTKYLLELSSGDDALSVNWKGETRKVIIGRNKVENRPLILIEAKVSSGVGDSQKDGETQTGGVILQNAETIRVISTGGKSISITNLKNGDKILVRIGEAGRHFGTQIKEKIIE